MVKNSVIHGESNRFNIFANIGLISGIRKQTFMGMSSSQARLLTLTARMHDIEYKAQRLEAQKLQMANESRRAYEDYLNELDRTKLEAKVINTDGSMTSIPFTADAVYTYKQLTSQYALKTADGKALIPQEYHDAYQSTENLSDYLNTFGVVSNAISYNVNTDEINPAWQNQYDAWKTEHDRWEADMALHSDWENLRGNYTEDHFQTQDLNTTDFVAATQHCTDEALGGDPECYQHVFGFILAYCDTSYEDSLYTDNVYDDYCYESHNDTYYDVYNIDVNKFDQTGDNFWEWQSTTSYSTSLGDNFNLAFKDLFYNGVYGSQCDPNRSGHRRRKAALIEISNKLHEKDETGKYKYNVPVEAGETFDLNTKIAAIQNNSSLTLAEKEKLIKQEKLMSIWKSDGTTKSMLEWAKDLYYLVKTSGSNPDQDVLNTVKTFIHKLDLFTKFDEPAWLAVEPHPGDEPIFDPTEDKFLTETREETTFTDKNYAQWLINIWYKMEGQDSVPQVQEKTVTDVLTGVSYKISSVENKTKTNPQAEGVNKYTNDYENENYIMIPQDKLNDPEWLKNCILEGWVLIQQFDKKGSKFNDTSVAVDTHLQEVSDEKNLKKAEAKYEADMRRIDQKDRRYDTQLAALDTERNAIKQEMETVKTVARDNVDRTFKLFS